MCAHIRSLWWFVGGGEAVFAINFAFQVNECLNVQAKIYNIYIYKEKERERNTNYIHYTVTSSKCLMGEMDECIWESTNN